MNRRYYYAEKDDGYIRDQSVFGDGISIEDTMCVLVRYNSGALMSYSLTAYAPKEGLRVVFTGTKGRMEYNVTEAVYINASGDQRLKGATVGKSLVVYPVHFRDENEGSGRDNQGFCARTTEAY